MCSQYAVSARKFLESRDLGVDLSSDLTIRVSREATSGSETAPCGAIDLDRLDSSLVTFQPLYHVLKGKRILAWSPLECP